MDKRSINRLERASVLYGSRLEQIIKENNNLKEENARLRAALNSAKDKITLALMRRNNDAR